MLLVPFLVGTVGAAASGAAAPWPGLSVVLTWVGGLSAYMMRQPATAWLRIRRALWAVREPRPVPDVKRFGFTEVGVELLSGALIALAYI